MTLLLVGCLLPIILLGIPRLIISYLFFFTGALSAAFSTWIWPLLGFLFLPWTTLFVTWAVNSGGGSFDNLGGWWILIILGILFDTSSWVTAKSRT